MIRIAVYVIISGLFLQFCNCSDSKRRLTQNQRLLQSQIQNCTLPGTSEPNIILLGMCADQLFIMPMSIGTPAQPLYFIVNTGQAYIQVLANQTNQIGFVESDSTTAKDSGQIVMIEMSNGENIPSTLANDFVSLNNGQNYSINTRIDILIIDQQVQNQYPQVISGVAGLGISELYLNIFEIAFKNQQISTATYTLSLRTSNQSYLYYNSLPPEIIDNSIFIESSTDNNFMLHIVGLSVGGTQYTAEAPRYATISSGNNYFYLNQKVYQSVVSHFFSGCTQTSMGPSCSCNDTVNWPVFSIMFEGAEIFIPGQSYITYLSNGSCTYGFGYIQNEKDVMILGSSFFVNYNLTFDSIDARIGIQGNLLPVQVIDFEYFVFMQYIFLIVAIGMAIAAGVLIWYLKVVEKEKPTRIIQFSISDRFIETD